MGEWILLVDAVVGAGIGYSVVEKFRLDGLVGMTMTALSALVAVSAVHAI